MYPRPAANAGTLLAPVKPYSPLAVCEPAFWMRQKSCKQPLASSSRMMRHSTHSIRKRTAQRPRSVLLDSLKFPLALTIIHLGKEVALS